MVLRSVVTYLTRPRPCALANTTSHILRQS